MSARRSIAVAATTALIVLAAATVGRGDQKARSASPFKQMRTSSTLAARVTRSGLDPSGSELARARSHARNGVIAYEWPDPQADFAYISFVPPSGGHLPEWARRMDGMEGVTPAFSPNGRSLAYSLGGPGDGLRVTPLGRGKARRVTRPSRNVWDTDPTWSPHGTRLAFGRSADTDEIYVVGSDGSHLRRLTGGDSPAWSSQGLIAFVRLNPSGNDQEGDIYVIDPGNGQVRQLTSGATDDAEPAWSRDGRSIAFSRNGHLFRIGRDGGPPRQLTGGRGDDSSPAFSPDGRQIVFVHVAHGRNRLNTIPVRGGTPRMLTSVEGAAGSLDCQPLRRRS